MVFLCQIFTIDVYFIIDYSSVVIIIFFISIHSSLLRIISNSIIFISYFTIPVGITFRKEKVLSSLKGFFGYSLVLDISLECFCHVGIGIFDCMLLFRYLLLTVVLIKLLKTLATCFAVCDSVFLLVSGYLFLRASSLLISEVMNFLPLDPLLDVWFLQLSQTMIYL